MSYFSHKYVMPYEPWSILSRLLEVVDTLIEFAATVATTSVSHTSC